MQLIWWGQKIGLFFNNMAFIVLCVTQPANNNLYNGLNNPVYHEQLIKEYLEVIPVMAKAGYKNLICFSGKREGMDDETGMKIVMKLCKRFLQLLLKKMELQW